MRKIRLTAVAVAACLAMVVSGCAQGRSADDTGSAEGSGSAAQQEQEQGSESGAGQDSSAQQEQAAADGIVLDIDGMDLEYSKRDLDASYDEESAVHLVLDGDAVTVKTADGATVAMGSGGSADADAAPVTMEGSVVTITSEGTYVISGRLDNGQLAVDVADENAKVQLVFDGVAIHNETGPAVYVRQVDKCFITLAEGSTNILTDGSSYELEEGSDEPYATLFSKDDLTLNGEGRLEVQSAYRHAICSKDDLVFAGGTYVVTATEDAVRGRDCVKVHDGEFIIEAGDAAVKSNNDEEGTRGFVVVDGGSFKISAGGDAFHAETLLQVNDGEIDIATCDEGLEGWQVTVNGGDVRIVSTDDGINAAAPDTAATTLAAGGMGAAGAVGGAGDGAGAVGAAGDGAGNVMRDGMGAAGAAGGAMAGGNALLDGAHESCLVEINGGYLVVDAGGDGVDSNGYFAMSGGVLLVMGPVNSADGAFDYVYEATISGGTLLMAGPSGMFQSLTSGEQPFLVANAGGQAGQTVAVVDGQGNVLVSMEAARQFSTVLASAPAMVDGETYSVVVGGIVAGANEDGYANEGSIAGGSSVQAVASTQGGGMGGMGGMGGQMPGGMGGMGSMGGQMPGGRGDRGTMDDFPGGTPPDGAETGRMPEGLAPGQMPEGFVPDGSAQTEQVSFA